MKLQMEVTLSLLILFLAQVSSQRKSETPLHVCCSIPRPIVSRAYAEDIDCTLANYGAGNVPTFQWKAPADTVVPPTNETVVFSLDHKDIACDEILEETFSFKSGDTIPRLNLTLTGHFQLRTEYYHSNEYCIHKLNETSLTVRYCKSECWPEESSVVRKEKEKPGNGLDKKKQHRISGCVRKCCDLGKIFRNVTDPMTGQTKLKCGWTNSSFTPTLYSSKSRRQLSKEDMKRLDYHIRKAPPSCEVGTVPMLLVVSKKNIKIFPGITGNLCYKTFTDGSFYYQDEKGDFIPRTEYCVEKVQGPVEDPGSEDWLEYAGSVTCSRPPSSEGSANKIRKLYGGLLICSSLFLLVTFIVYVLLWDQHGLHGWTTLGHTSSMFWMYIFLGSSQIMNAVGIMQTLGCVIVGVFAHFFFISTFCWLTLISFDLWYTFRNFTPKSNSKRLKRFAFYVFFGWGVPAILIVVALVLDNVYKDADCLPAILPLYGQINCFVNPLGLGEYLYYPIAVLLILNLIFFGVTTWKLYEYKQSTRIATLNLENKRQFFKLFVKLFCVMGITWMFEVISWLHVGYHVTWYYNIIDCVNVCQAFAIFIIYVCKKETILALEKRYPSLKVILDPFIRLFKCRQTGLDSEQMSSLNSSMNRRSTGKSRTSVLSKFGRNSSSTTTTDTSRNSNMI